MGFITVDLGTTNVKVAIYDKDLNIVNITSSNIEYRRKDEIVEFDADEYYRVVAKTIKECCGGFLASSNEY